MVPSDHYSSSLGTGTSASRVGRVVVFTLLLLVAVEVAVEWRAYLRYGVTVMDAFRDHPLYVVDPDTGLKLLRPSAIISGRQQTIRTNSLGLRSPEIAPNHPPEVLRLAVIGASSVMGATERDNEHTFPAQLEAQLREAISDRRVEVINAGIAGYSLTDEQAMLERRIAPLHPDLVLLYPGSNDFTGYCRPPVRNLPMASRRHVLTVPRWWLSYELLKQNTAGLRVVPSTARTTRDASKVDLAEYRADAEHLITAAQRLGIAEVLLTNARSFRREQPLSEQMRLSTMSRYYANCFDLDGLHILWDRHNDVLASIAREHQVPVLALDKLVPGGDLYFADGNHFSEAGDLLVARMIAKYLIDRHLLQTEDPR